MTNNQPEEQYVIGMVGLGVMGRNLLLNMADRGFRVAGYDKDSAKVEALSKESQSEHVRGATTVNEFITLLRKPRAVMMLVPAGAPVDSVISDLMPYMQTSDLIIDAGNSYFKDTDLRTRRLSEKGIQFLGVGVSGGEEGARRGPSIMPGGPKEAYESVRPIFEAVAAKVDGEPCVTYLGPGAAGHFVKMVHNGIEYGIMQLIAETYDVMKRGVGLNDDELHDVYESWNKREPNCYLLEITSHIFQKVDERTGKRLIDEILDVAKQKGTGMWTSQSAMELSVPIPTIDTAVEMRNLSMLDKQRETAATFWPQPAVRFSGDRRSFLDQLCQGLYAAMIITYAQGFAVLAAASDKYRYQYDLAAVASIWRGGCIIRASLLASIRKAYERQPGLSSLLLDGELAAEITSHEDALRGAVVTMAQLGIPAAGFMSALAYLDAFHSAWLPANLIQAQRDYFGAHTYERVDAQGTFHTDWERNS